MKEEKKVNPYIYIGYKEGKHWCREVNPIKREKVTNRDYRDAASEERRIYDDNLRQWQAAESQLMEFEIETGVIAVYKDLSGRIMFEHGKVLKTNDQFNGEQINNKVRIV